MFNIADGKYFGSISHRYKEQQAILNKSTFMRGPITEQTCASFFYSKIFGACCLWLDSNELFKASHAKSIPIIKISKFQKF